MSELTTYTVENKKGQKKQPEWLRTVLRSDDGELFIPGAVTGNEQAAFLCASFDGVCLASFKKHTFLPVSWLKKEYPKNKELMELIAVLENREWHHD